MGSVRIASPTEQTNNLPLNFSVFNADPLQRLLNDLSDYVWQPVTDHYLGPALALSPLPLLLQKYPDVAKASRHLLTDEQLKLLLADAPKAPVPPGKAALYVGGAVLVAGAAATAYTHLNRSKGGKQPLSPSAEDPIPSALDELTDQVFLTEDPADLLDFIAREEDVRQIQQLELWLNIYREDLDTMAALFDAALEKAYARLYQRPTQRPVHAAPRRAHSQSHKGTTATKPSTAPASTTKATSRSSSSSAITVLIYQALGEALLDEIEPFKPLDLHTALTRLEQDKNDALAGLSLVRHVTTAMSHATDIKTAFSQMGIPAEAMDLVFTYYLHALFGDPVIAMDGPAASGKGTLSRTLARLLGHPDIAVRIIPTGDFFRAVTTYFLDMARNHGLSLPDPKELNTYIAAINNGSPLPKLPLAAAFYQFIIDQLPTLPAFGTRLVEDRARVMMGDMDVTDRLQTQETTQWVSVIAQIKALRNEHYAPLVGTPSPYTILDGRDLYAVVPVGDETYRIYVWVSTEERARRAVADQTRGYDMNGVDAALQKALEDLTARDVRDQSRTQNPLLTPEGARESGRYDLVLEADGLTPSQTAHTILDVIVKRRAKAYQDALSKP